MKYKLVLGVMTCLAAMAVVMDSYGLTTSRTSRQSAIQQGTTVRTKVEAVGLYDQACYDAYFGCMDQFCITDNASGGACTCSDDITEYDQELTAIKEILDEANRLRTEEVERIQAGADADIIFSGERRYDADGNILDLDEMTEEEERAARRESLLAMFNTSIYDDEEDLFSESSVANMADLVGQELYQAANELCLAQVPDSCAGDMVFLQQLYSRQIVSDCLGYKNSLAAQRDAAEVELAAAESEVRAALQESLDSANKYDLGQCMVEFKKCMQTEDACGENWENCVATVATENMQNNAATSTAGTTYESAATYDITVSTMEILDTKRPICERVLDQCVAVRDMVWPNFLREAAPTIRVAESQAESKFRQSCLTNISECITNACRDDIAGKGVATMDACLSRPDMARSFCKVEIDPCERMEPLIWGYVEDKLAAMRVDACTQEVKDCFTADTRCGPNFENCIGMDYDYIHDICPIDSLVVCKANNPNFSMDDLDDMLMGLYLNIDNSMMDQCQNLVDTKMAEICGSTTDCNRFAADDTIGTGSLRSQKDGDLYRVTGMISFGSIKMGEGEQAGQIDVSEYIEQIKSRNADVADSEGIIASIEEELNNIAGTINRTISMISEDPEIQYCVTGRSLEQITGEEGAKTTGRFPNLLNQVKMQIAVAALRQAQDNYNEKLNTAIAEATRDASVDLAQYMCQKIAENGGDASGMTIAESTPLTTPYSISYDVGVGLTAEDLTRGGAGVIQSGGATFVNKGYLGGGASIDGGGMSKEVTAIFSRDTRTCHICTTITTENCKTTGSVSWFHNNRNVDCTTETSGPVCEDIVM